MGKNEKSQNRIAGDPGGAGVHVGTMSQGFGWIRFEMAKERKLWAPPFMLKEYASVQE